MPIHPEHDSTGLDAALSTESLDREISPGTPVVPTGTAPLAPVAPVVPEPEEVLEVEAPVEIQGGDEDTTLQGGDPNAEPLNVLSDSDPIVDYPESSSDDLYKNLLGIGERTPEAEADLQKTAKEAGLPRVLVDEDSLPDIKRDLTVNGIMSLLDEAPVTKKLLSFDGDLAPLIGDDIKSLVKFEKSVGKLTFTGAFSRGVDILQEFGYRFLEATGELVGSEALEAFGQEGAERNQAEAGAGGSKQRFQDITDAGGFLNWMKQTAGEQMPTMAPTVAGGLAGAAIGSAVPVIGTVIGGVLGTFIPSLVLGVGETQSAIKRKNKDVEAPLTSFGSGAIIAALDSVLPYKIGSALVKAFGREAGEQAVKLAATKIMSRAGAAKIAKTGAKTMTLEGITEAVQEAVSETAASSATGTEVNVEELTDQMIEAFAAGAFMGGAVGVGGKVTTDLIKSRREKQALDEISANKADTKLQDRSPEKAAQLAAATLRERGVNEVFISTEALLRWSNTQENPLEALQLLGIEGIESGFDDISVNVAALSTYVLGKPGAETITSHIKLNRDKPSFHEASEEIFNDEQTAVDLAADLEAYDAHTELKERVQQTIGKVKPGNAADILDGAPEDVYNVLTDLVERASERRLGIEEVARQGRVSQLDQDLSVMEAAAVRISDEIEAIQLDNEGKPRSQQKATAALFRRLETALDAAEQATVEQISLISPELQVEPGIGFDGNIVEEGSKVVAAKVADKKAIKIKAKTLEQLGVQSTKEVIRATRAAFKAGVKASQNVIERQSAIVKNLGNIAGLKPEQINQLSVRINKPKTVAQLNKVIPQVRARAAQMVESNQRTEIRDAIKKVLKKGKVKQSGKRPLGRGDADAQIIIDKAREDINTPVKEAKLLLDAEIVNPQQDPEGFLRRQLLAVAARDDRLTTQEAQNLLTDLAALIEDSNAVGRARFQARVQKRDADIAEAIDLISQGERTIGDIDPAGFWKTMKAKAQDVTTALGSMHNGWDDLLDISLNKKGVTARDLIESLRMTKFVQKAKGRAFQWQAEFTEMGMRTLGVKNQQRFVERITEDSKRIEIGTFVNKRGESYRVSRSKAEIRKLWMERQDPTLRSVVQHKEGNAFTDEMMRAMFAHLDQTDYDFALGQLALYKKWYQQVNKVYRRTRGVDLPFNEFYSPIQRDVAEMAGDGKDRFGTDSIIADEPKFRSAVADALKSRATGVILPLMRSSDIGAINRYIHDMTWFIETSEQVVHIKSVFASKKLQKVIKEFHGNSMNGAIQSFIEDFGPGQVKRGGQVEEMIGNFNRRFSKSVLALKPTIGVKQLVSYFAMMDNVPVADFMASQADFFKSPTGAKKIVKQLFENVPGLAARGSSLDFVMASIGSADPKLFQHKKSQQVEDILFAAIRLGDRFPIYAGGWAIYKNAKKQGFGDEVAYQMVSDAINSTQQSVDIDKMSGMQRSGAIGRTLTMFMTSRMSLLRGELRAIRQRPIGLGGRGKISYREFGKRMAYYHFVIPMMIQYISSGFEWEEDRMLVAATLGQLNSFVIFGDMLMSAAASIYGDDTFGRNLANEIPLAKVTAELYKGVADALGKNTSATEELEALRDVMGAVGKLSGVPADQVMNIVSGINNVNKGNHEQGMKQIFGFSEKVAETSSK
jgi:hypothetical protein